MKELFYFLFFIFTFFLKIESDQSCAINSKHCTKCNLLTDLCVICEKREVFIPDTTGGCKGSQTCQVVSNYCNECDLEGKYA